VPTIDQFVPDEANRRLFDYFIAPAQLAYPFAAPPGVPDDRIAVLRQAFNETVADPDFIADAVRQGVHPSLTKGEDMNPIIAKVYALPVATLKQLREMGGKSAAPTVAMLQ
jgi:hypothetical protein